MGKSGCSREKLFCSGKVVVFEQSGFLWESGCIRAKVVVFGQKWLHSGIVVVFVQKWLNSGKSYSILAKWLYSGKSGCIRSKW